MGLRYVVFRTWHILQIKTGWMKIRFPKHSSHSEFISLKVWRDLPVLFFQKGDKSNLLLKDGDLNSLKERVEMIHENKFFFFSSSVYTMTDWHTNPETGFIYSRNQHWSGVPDFSGEAGDIKNVWEKSRFTFLYDLIRYDFHFLSDQSDLVFDQIESWIKANPVNCGPNWKCSQEITLRVLNWTFGLQYYKNSSSLTPQIFNGIINSIHRQMQHVEQNINFSRIAVRNNHAITETLGLYLTGLLYPFFPESARWKEKGRKWFEEEIAYQIYEDGTFLQFSMNYHRVVIQLFTWAIKLAELNGEKWDNMVYDRAEKSVRFLRACQDNKTGWLPNYGNNDGALFFPLTDCHFRDFRPQLNALAGLLQLDLGYEMGPWEEEMFWLGGQRENYSKESSYSNPDFYTFINGGYYVLRDADSITFLRCGSYKDRPFQTDNLHLDIWVDGENILRDGGSFKYNTHEKLSRYFMGTASHNTIMLGDFDQMSKGSGFVWHDWIRNAGGAWKMDEEGKSAIFDGEFLGFRQLKDGIKHRRRVRKIVGRHHWEIEDWIENAPDGIAMNQLWHPSEAFFGKYRIRAFDKKGKEIELSISPGWYSGFYGQKEECRQMTFSTNERYIRTIIQKG